jgi:hypothetical protein
MQAIPHSILYRIPRVHLAADADRSTEILAGAWLKCTAGVLVITATDGKLLIEECYSLPASGDFSVILSGDAIRRLGSFLKATENKRADANCTLSIDTPTAATITHPNGTAMMMPLCEGAYPDFSACWSGNVDAGGPSMFCTSGDYVATLAKVWGNKSSTALVYEWSTRYLRVKPLNPNPMAKYQRAILMPISMPSNKLPSFL